MTQLYGNYAPFDRLFSKGKKINANSQKIKTPRQFIADANAFVGTIVDIRCDSENSWFSLSYLNKNDKIYCEYILDEVHPLDPLKQSSKQLGVRHN